MHEIIQLAVNGVVNGAAYGLLGVAFALILGVTGRFHFAFSFTYTLTAYVTAISASELGVPAVLAILLGLLVGTIAGVLCEALVYRPLAKRAQSNTLLIIFVASLGLSIAGQSLIQLLWGFGSVTRSFTPFAIHTETVGGINFTSLDIISVVVISAVILATTLFMRSSSEGRQIKAVRVNPEMAQAVGIDSARIYRLVFGIGSVLGGIAALLFTMKYAAAPDMGNRPVFYALLVAFLGGTGRAPWKIGLTGVGLGVIESVSGRWVSAQWSSLVVFVILFLYLSQRSAGGLRGLTDLVGPRRRVAGTTT